jgi:hypothetical protein
MKVHPMFSRDKNRCAFHPTLQNEKRQEKLCILQRAFSMKHLSRSTRDPTAGCGSEICAAPSDPART